MHRVRMLVVVLLLVAAACGGDDTADTTSTAPSTTSETTTTIGADPTTTTLATTTTTDPPETTTTEASAASAAVWVTDQAAGNLVKVDPASGDTIFVSGLTGPTNGVALGAGSAWVALSSPANALARVDGESGEVLAIIEIGSGTAGVAFSDGFAWVSSFEAGTVTQIDPATNEIVATIDVGDGATGLTAGSVWATAWTDKALNKIEVDGTVTSVDLPGAGSAPAVGGGYVAATLFNSGEVIVFDETLTEVGIFDTGNNANVISWGFGVFWATNSATGEVWRIDPAAGTAEVATVVPGALGIVAGADMIYVASFDTGKVYQFPPDDPSAMNDLMSTGGSAFEVAFGAAG